MAMGIQMANQLYSSTMNHDDKYDVAIVGGGLAGLSLSIQLANKGHKVALFEKEKYPFHKVCGEYISMESWPFLERLGLPLSGLNLPLIKTLQLTAPNGSMFTTNLPLGGFGISRYAIDKMLADIAVSSGVHLFQETRVDDVVFENDASSIQYSSAASGKSVATAKICCGSFGKRSNLDIKWKRDFAIKSDSKANNYVAVKYHVQTQWPYSAIGLHNFLDGYCGISKIEDNKYCLCYLTTAENLKRNGNSIPQMERDVLYQNPHLKKIFSNSKFVQDFPIAISQISFDKKELVENRILMVGDAAGMITPLCGNGMSMAMHGSKIAAQCVDDFLLGNYARPTMELNYRNQWENLFQSRLKTGRVLQRFFGSKTLSNLFVGAFKIAPFLAQTVIKKTHGQPF